MQIHAILWPLAGLAFSAACSATPPTTGAPSVLAKHAHNVSITRDDWGIAHIHGKTDADAVFGMMYAQAEDDFNRIETNYLQALGRLAEAEGEAEIYRDLRMKLFIDPTALRALYCRSPAWLQRLMQAWADGLNYYLATHPQVKPRVITHFEPWMALSFSEGSIGGDIERIQLPQLQNFYGDTQQQLASTEPMPTLVEPTGSNGFAIAPANTLAGKALLWINPHTSFFFRSEQQVRSDMGLNTYGAATWGQFFIYQGFNERLGWMHTSSNVDNIDEYQETIEQRSGTYYYRYGGLLRPVQVQTLHIPYATPQGLAHKDFTVYRTHHGPIVRKADGKWISVRLMHAPLQALMQSYGRTKARNLREFRAVLDLHTNSSNNTVYADADGNIAYFHANFIPRRNTRFDWTQPVDGSNPATEWGPPLSVSESPLLVNPPNGWIQNTNNWPYSAAGAYSPRKQDFARYVDEGHENPRGIHAIQVLDHKRDFTPDTLMAAAYDSDQPAFHVLIPRLLKAYAQLDEGDGLKQALAAPMEVLRGWDYRWSVDSVANTLAVLWAEDLWLTHTADAKKAGITLYEFLETQTTAQQQLQALARVCDRLTADFGNWRTHWGDVNRFQRISPQIKHPFSDAAPSIPVGFSSARWGSLASFGAKSFDGSKKIYGTSGNSFVAVVEFGSKVKARAISAGGQSGDPASPHFQDQALRYSQGDLREVYFYPEQLQGHTERRYHPGE